MKKLISLALAVVMIISLSTAAFAETVTAPGANTAEVTGSYVEGWESNGIVYSVTIDWSDLDFTYHAERGAVWDPETLTYSETKAAYWDGTGTITVTNRSNTKILAVPEYAAEEGYESATMTFDPTELKVASAVVGTAQTGIITVTPGGSLPELEEKTTIGTITLTISQDTDVTLEEAEALLADAEELFNSKSSVESEEDKNKFDEMYTLMNNLQACRNAFYTDATDANQRSLNSAYASLLGHYNICLDLIQ